MEKIGDDAASRFISALIKSVQTLCHGYIDFETGIEIIGHINLNVDKGSSLDYVLKEKVCKNAENSTLFISNSFHAEPKPDQDVTSKQSQSVPQNSESTDAGETTKVSSAISSISSALTGIRDSRRGHSGVKSESFSSHERTYKRKASDHSSEAGPAKMFVRRDSSHLLSDSPHHNTNSPVDSKLGLQRLHSAEDGESETMLPQTANVSENSDLGVNLAGSVLEPVENQGGNDLPERDDDSDGDLEVTFIKEEYVEGDRSACDFDNSGGQQYMGGPFDPNSEGMPDPSVFPVSLHPGSASSTYVPSSQDHGQHYSSGGIPSHAQPGPSGTRGNVSQQNAAQPLPPGTKPSCGYVHPSDAQKWRGEGAPSAAGGSGSQGNRGSSEAKNVSKEELERLLHDKVSITEMAHRLNMSRPTMYKLLKKHKLDSAFKYITNERIVELMAGVVAEFPQALTDPVLMNQRLMMTGIMALSRNRLINCMTKLHFSSTL